MLQLHGAPGDQAKDQHPLARREFCEPKQAMQYQACYVVWLAAGHARTCVREAEFCVEQERNHAKGGAGGRTAVLLARLEETTALHIRLFIRPSPANTACCGAASSSDTMVFGIAICPIGTTNAIVFL